jgi:zinc transport system permease protein
MRLFHSFKSVTVFSALVSVLCALVGILLSILAGTPVGSTIVAVNALAFLLCWAAGKIVGRARA